MLSIASECYKVVFQVDKGGKNDKLLFQLNTRCSNIHYKDISRFLTATKGTQHRNVFLKQLKNILSMLTFSFQNEKDARGHLYKKYVADLVFAHIEKN